MLNHSFVPPLTIRTRGRDLDTTLADVWHKLTRSGTNQPIHTHARTYIFELELIQSRSCQLILLTAGFYTYLQCIPHVYLTLYAGFICPTGPSYTDTLCHRTCKQLLRNLLHPSSHCLRTCTANRNCFGNYFVEV